MYYRTKFVITELEKICNKLKVESPNEEFTQLLESDTDFIKIVNSLIKINEEASKFENVILDFYDSFMD